MNSLINIINKLQEISANSSIKTRVQLPQIVVVGSQSSGKTSILESIVGKDFLPRGSGIVTRRPLILQLKNISSGKEWCEFNHTGKERFEDFDRVLDEIDKETQRIAGKGKGISSDPIILKIYSPKIVDLTLVDLPGLVKVAIGDQPHDIDLLVRNLVLEYISNPNALILAITPANSDIANSDALKIAKEVDPFYQRTIGVVTKIDLMDHGTDALDILTNKTFPLKLGYIGVICRSQKDINSKKSIEEAFKSEADFFDSHFEYKPVRNLLGIKNLTQSLSTILMNHIRNILPNIKETISTEIFEKEKELNLLGSDNGFDKVEVINSYILTLVSKFTHTYNEMIEGNFVRDCSKYFIGGARINYIFQEIFRKEINNLDPFDSLSDEDIRTAIKNSNGLKPSLFIPEAAFEVLIKQQIYRFINPSLLCVKRVYDELKGIVASIDIPEITRYKKLEIKIKGVMENVLDRCLEPTNQMIKNLIDIEQAYINTSHPDFLGPEQSVLNLFDENIQNNNNNNQQNDNGNNIRLFSLNNYMNNSSSINNENERSYNRGK
jgi:replication fork clamp-binding protein CrfC